MIRLAVVDDHPLVAEGIRSLLSAAPDVAWAWHAGDAQACLSHLRQLQPDVLLLDINLPGKSGLDLCSELRALYPALHVIALSTYNQGSYVKKMLEAGADGYLLKNATREEILEALLVVMKGRQYLSFEASAAIRQREGDAPAILTRREQEVLALIAEGLTNAAIAEQLFVSITTVDSHRKHLLEKLAAKNTAALVKIAIGLKLLDA